MHWGGLGKNPCTQFKGKLGKFPILWKFFILFLFIMCHVNVIC